MPNQAAPHSPVRSIAIIGAGPAGLMAAETLAAAGIAVDLYDAMPSIGRKFLMAGRGGLNLTHSEPFPQFCARYGDAADRLGPILAGFTPDDLRAWASGLGIETFIGSSGRVFPRGLKASPLLRGWAGRLGALGVRFHLRCRWQGFDGAGGLVIAGPEPGQQQLIHPDAAILALGGASWPRLGSDGGWAAVLAAIGVTLTPFQPANAGFLIDWSPHFVARWAGTPLKNLGLRHGDRHGVGEAMLTATGIEGGGIYALGAGLRNAIAKHGAASLVLDLKPGLSLAELTQRFSRPRQGASLSSFLRKAGGLPPVTLGLLREAGVMRVETPADLAQSVKACRLPLKGVAPLDRAISTAGGVAWSAVDDGLMLRARPGLFIAGEMLDWEAPTGGYLLQACFATGRHAGLAVLGYLDQIAI